MVEIINIYLNEDTLVTLEDHFEDKKNQTLHRFFYEKIRDMAKEAKMSDDAQKFAGFVVEDKKPTQKITDYKDVDLAKYTLPSDPEWRPKNLVPEKITTYQLKVGDKTHNSLLQFSRIFGAKIENYNKSVPEVTAKEDGKEVIKLDPRFPLDIIPICFEQVINMNLTNPIQLLLGSIAQEIFDKENEEIEKQEKLEKEKLTAK